MRLLILGGITVRLRAGLTLTQTYDDEDASSDARMGDDSLRRQTYGTRKLSTEIVARGIIPPGLESLDFNQPMTISCVEPIAVTSANPNIVLPAARRSDAGSEPIGHAFIGERIVRTPLAMNGDTAELTPVTGNSGYEALYFPEFECFARLGRRTQPRGGQIGWTLTARER